MNLFSSKIYGQICKKMRLKNNLTLANLSELICMEIAAISRLETGSQLPFEKYELLFDYFNIDKNFIDKAENELSSAFIQFMQAIIDISPDVENYYLYLQNIFEGYKNSIFSFVFDLSYFIYSYFERKYTILQYQSFLDNIEFLSDEYQAYVYIYIAQYFESCKDMANALKYFDKAELKAKKNKQVDAFYYYTMSRYYLDNSDIIEALNYNEKASNLFLELQNYNRLVNINIQKGKLYRCIHMYEKALEVDMATLSHIEDSKTLELERNSLLNNIGWTYLLMEHYQDALNYFTQMSYNRKRYHHFFDESICYIMLKKDDKAYQSCKQGLQAEFGEEEDYKFLNWLKIYLENKEDKKILTKYKKIYNQYKKQLTNLDCEYYLKLLMHFYIEQKSYKNATNVALEILSLKNN